jgi:hypothetical protein
MFRDVAGSRDAIWSFLALHGLSLRRSDVALAEDDELEARPWSPNREVAGLSRKMVVRRWFREEAGGTDRPELPRRSQPK